MPKKQRANTLTPTAEIIQDRKHHDNQGHDWNVRVFLRPEIGQISSSAPAQGQLLQLKQTSDATK